VSIQVLTGKKTIIYSDVTRLILADAEGIRSSVNCLAIGKTTALANEIRGQSEHIVILFFKAFLALSVGGRYAGTAQTPDSCSMGAFPTRE
jgi:hypothetical protein